MKALLHPLTMILSIVCCLTSCQQDKRSTPTKEPVEFSQNVMTIDYRILVGNPAVEKNRASIQLIIDAVFDEVNQRFNQWNPLSEISQLNTLPAHTSQKLSPELFHFLEQVDILVNLSEGRFDPTIEPLYQLWKGKLDNHSIPSNEEIDAIKPCIGWDKIQFQEGIFIKEDRRTQLNFGGVAKGWCVDHLIQKLQSAGFRNLYVEWGGEIRTAGSHPSGRPWKVYISKFGNPDPEQAIAHLNLINQALATSGDYYQNWTIRDLNGKERSYSHVINPLTYSPQEIKIGSIASASLLTKDCMTADALAKVPMLFDTVKDAENWINELQKRHPDMVYWLMVRS